MESLRFVFVAVFWILHFDPSRVVVVVVGFYLFIYFYYLFTHLFCCRSLFCYVWWEVEEQEHEQEHEQEKGVL